MMQKERRGGVFERLCLRPRKKERGESPGTRKNFLMETKGSKIEVSIVQTGGGGGGSQGGVFLHEPFKPKREQREEWGTATGKKSRRPWTPMQGKGRGEEGGGVTIKTGRQAIWGREFFTGGTRWGIKGGNPVREIIPSKPRPERRLLGKFVGEERQGGGERFVPSSCTRQRGSTPQSTITSGPGRRGGGEDGQDRMVGKKESLSHHIREGKEKDGNSTIMLVRACSIDPSEVKGGGEWVVEHAKRNKLKMIRGVKQKRGKPETKSRKNRVNKNAGLDTGPNNGPKE